MDGVGLCICGCGNPPTRGKWVAGHWNRGKKHPDRAAPGTRPIRVKKTHEERSEIARATRLRMREEGRFKPLPEPKPCACGCGTQVKGTFAQGHHVRMPGSNPYTAKEVQRRSRETRAKMKEEGTFPSAWSKGLTKETDERVVLNGLRGSASIMANPEERKRRSEQMKKDRLDGTIPTLSGPGHSQWKGGTSSISQRLRGSALYREWKFPILQRDGFSCRRCGKGSLDARLAVHHDQVRFASILHRCMPDFAGERELTWDEQTAVVDEVVRIHLEEKVSGITLCYDCHFQVHREEGSEDLD